MSGSALSSPGRLLHSHPRVGIVGGTHGTGAQFARVMGERGFDVRVSGRKTEMDNATLAQQSDLLVFAPPLKHCVSIIKEVIPYCQRPDQLVVDLCSLKEAPMQAMGEAKGRVVGLHPLFGPGFSDLRGQDLVLCDPTPEQGEPLYQALREELLAWGLKVHEMSAQAHDKLMATIQVIPHMSALISGALFRELGIDVAQSLAICSPVYKTELYMIGRIHSQNPALYASIIAQNPHSTTVVSKLAQIVGTIRGGIEAGDIEALQSVFFANQEHFGDFAQEALAQSQHLLQAAFGQDAPSKRGSDGDSGPR